MREIKFRVWEPKVNKMWAYDPLWGNRHTTGGGWLCVLPIGEERSYRSFSSDDNRIAIDTEDIVLLQFTGLKDKNGVDIYEGDVVQTNHVSKGVIEWSSMASQWWIKFTDEVSYRKSYRELVPDYGDGQNYCQYLEIIGNVHQHENLLK